MRQLRGNFADSISKFHIQQQPDVSTTLQPDDVLILTKACALDLASEKVHHQLLSSNLDDCPVGQTVSGVIVNTGSNVERFVEDMNVVGILPFGQNVSGCSDKCILSQFDIFEKPNSISHEVAAASLSAGLSAYTAVHYQGHVTAGDTLLVLDAATPRAYFTVQLAQSFGAKILATYRTIAEKQLLESLKNSVAQLIEMTERSTILASSVMEETGGVGVDCIIDNGVRLFTSEEDKDLMDEHSMKNVPHKHELLSCLGFAGRWVTTHPHLQLDPPDSKQMFLRGASLSFLFPPAWTLMRSQHGRFLHIIQDILERVAIGDFKVNDIINVNLDEAEDLLTKGEFDSSKAVVIVL